MSPPFSSPPFRRPLLTDSNRTTELFAWKVGGDPWPTMPEHYFANVEADTLQMKGVGRDGKRQAGPPPLSAGCAALSGKIRDFAASGRPRAETLFLNTLGMACFDIDTSSATPIGVSIPRQPFLERSAAGTPEELHEALGEGRWGQTDAWNLPYLYYFPYRGAKVKDLVLFLHEAILPRLPPGAKGSFVYVLEDIEIEEAATAEQVQVLYDNGTPPMLHAFLEETPFMRAWPDLDTLRAHNEVKLQHVSAPEARVAWSAKEPRVLFRGGPHGPREWGVYPDQLGPAEMEALSGAPELRSRNLANCANKPRVQLAVLCREVAALQGLCDVKLSQGVGRKCSNGGFEALGLAEAGEADYVAFEAWQRYRAVFNVDGYGAAFSFAARLGLGSPVVKLVSPLRQEFERFLEPGVHYVPVDLRNVSAVVPYVLDEANAAEMQEVAWNAGRVVAERLGLAATTDRAAAALAGIFAQMQSEGAGSAGGTGGSEGLEGARTE